MSPSASINAEAVVEERNAGPASVPSAEAELQNLSVEHVGVDENVKQQVEEELRANPSAEKVLELPPAPKGLAGTSAATGKNYSVTVSNKAGYMCHVHVVANWDVPPEVPFAIFTHPDNSRLFRDIQRVGQRKVIKTEPAYKEVQVEQLGDIQILWIHRTYSTWLHVIEDSRDPDCLRTKFELLRSDVLGKFSGEWELRAVRDPSSGKVVGCRGELVQDVLPKGMPAFMARLPVLGSVLRGISVRAVTRVMDDINIAMGRICAGHAAGRSTAAMMKELCGEAAEAGCANGAVSSFAFDAAEDGGSEDGGEEDETTAAPEAGQQAQQAAGQGMEQEAGGQVGMQKEEEEEAVASKAAAVVAAVAVTADATGTH
ncbi:hypothetical protein HYH02_010522 [Chlamydomonas schloesseri]|uniref:Coenzyme Q-binding protein COQ10 START domain-containing protein n=1 Tax=Chlamydomonas schloesseri TaxID=2026947 RepID=A0A835TA55_9CHLO|nr:hypothetical protein HYH02_010522 [Chlamydomonas schloesseri]|eukprot:KAG2439892.1 hypothetical protein HYH02_010522 [Chlamydomonas schloesseri]